MEDLKNFLRKGTTVHSSIAGKMAGGVLRCAVCHRCTSPTDSEISNYLAFGWPKCCGEQMSWAVKKGETSAQVRK